MTCPVTHIRWFESSPGLRNQSTSGISAIAFFTMSVLVLNMPSMFAKSVSISASRFSGTSCLPKNDWRSDERRLHQLLLRRYLEDSVQLRNFQDPFHKFAYTPQPELDPPGLSILTKFQHQAQSARIDCAYSCQIQHHRTGIQL